MGQKSGDADQYEIRISSDNYGTGTSNYVRMYTTTGSVSDTWGIEGFSGGDRLFHLGETNSANDNVIAGWNFDTQKLYNSTNIVLDGTNKKIGINDDAVKMYYTDASNWGVSGSGFQLGSTNEIGGFTFTDTQIKSGSNFTLDTTQNRGEIRLGGATNLTTGDGFYVNGNGSFRVGGASDNYVKFDGNGLQIKSDPLTLDSNGDLTISGTISSSAGEIAGWELKENYFKSPDEKIILRSDSASIAAWPNTTAVDYVVFGQTFDGTNFTGNYGISAVDNSGNYLFRLDDSVRQIAGWNFDTTQIQKTGSSVDGIVIDSDNKALQVIATNGATAYGRVNTRLLLGQVSTADYGIKGFNDSGNRIFELSDNRTEIAGWTFTQKTIKKVN